MYLMETQTELSNNVYMYNIHRTCTCTSTVEPVNNGVVGPQIVPYMEVSLKLLKRLPLFIHVGPDLNVS